MKTIQLNQQKCDKFEIDCVKKEIEKRKKIDNISSSQSIDLIAIENIFTQSELIPSRNIVGLLV